MGTLETETDASGVGGGPGAASSGPPRWLSAEEQEAWRAHLATSKLLTRQLDRDLHPFGLNINNYEILVVLSEAPEHRLRMTDLADATAPVPEPTVPPDHPDGSKRAGAPRLLPG